MDRYFWQMKFRLIPADCGMLRLMKRWTRTVSGATLAMLKKLIWKFSEEYRNKKYGSIDDEERNT